MQTLERVRDMLDRNGIPSKSLPPNEKLDWVLICEKYRGSKLGIGIAQIKNTETIEVFLHMKLGPDVISALKEKNLNNEFINEFDIVTKSLAHVQISLTPRLPDFNSISILRKLYGEFDQQRLMESIEKVFDSVSLILALIRKHGKIQSPDATDANPSFIG